MIRAIVRVRGGPAGDADVGVADEEEAKLVEIVNDKRLRIFGADEGGDERSESREFEFSRCFGPETSQEEFYSGSGVEDLIRHALSGYAATLFTYGATGSGKTYTTFGTDGAEGCFGHAMRTIFSLIETPEFQGTTVRMSSVEIYDDRLSDLLQRPPRGPRAGEPSGAGLKWSAREQGFVLKNVQAVGIKESAQGLACLRKTMQHRRVAAHALNDRSSRSHCITILFLENPVSGKYGKIMFCDLAGSERIKKTASQNAKESGGLNKSLFTLSKVVRALGIKGGAKPPYRDAALTKLLCSSLGGCSMCVMIACISPHAPQIAESARTLRFAARTMRIRNKPIVFRSKHERLVEKLRTQIRELTEENLVLRQQVEELSSPARGPRAITSPAGGPRFAGSQTFLDREGPKASEAQIQDYQEAVPQVDPEEEWDAEAERLKAMARGLNFAQHFASVDAAAISEHGMLREEGDDEEARSLMNEHRAAQESFRQGLYRAFFDDHATQDQLSSSAVHSKAQDSPCARPPVVVPRAPVPRASPSSKAMSPRVQKLALTGSSSRAKPVPGARARSQSKANKLRKRALRDEVESAQVQQVVSNWITHHRTRFSNDFVF